MKIITRGLVLSFTLLAAVVFGYDMVMAEENADNVTTIQNVDNEENLTETDNQTQTETETKTDSSTLSREEKFRKIIERSFAKCKVCKDIEDHKEHMAMDSRMRKFLWDPEKYYDSDEVDTVESDYLSESDMTLEEEAELNTETEEVTGEETDARTDAEEAIDAQPDEEEVETQPGTEIITEEETEEPVVETTSQPEQPETDMQPEAEPQSEVEVQPEADMQPEAEPQPEVEVQPETDMQPEAEPQTETEPQPDVEPQVEGDAQAETEPQPVDEGETVPQVKVPGSDSLSDLELLYRLVESEAGIESSRCKEMVAAVVLNRVASDRFPNSIRGVIYAPGAFAVTNNNVINRVKVTQDTIDAVNRVYYGNVNVPGDIYFFRNKHFFSWCKPAFSIDHTYFSKYYD